MDRLDAVAVVHSRSMYRTRRPSGGRARSRGPDRRRCRIPTPARHRVVQAAARVEGVLDVAPQDRLDRPERAAATAAPASCIPANAGSSPPVRSRPRRARTGQREPLDGLDVAARVAPLEVTSGAGSGARPGSAPTAAAGRSPARTAAVSADVRPEIVVGGPRPEDEEHGSHDTLRRRWAGGGGVRRRGRRGLSVMPIRLASRERVLASLDRSP